MPREIPLPESDGPPCALFLDVDGTLIELADHPNDISVPKELSQLLDHLRDSLNGAMALVSGRGIGTLDNLFAPSTYDAAGCHGAEIRIQGRQCILSESQPLVGNVANRLIAETYGLKNVFVEIKSQSVAVHHRRSSADPSDVISAIERALSFAPGQFRILPGKGVFEAVGRHVGKDAAIARFLTEAPYIGRHPIFIGDDITDEAAFEEVNRRNGTSIHVGYAAGTSARYCIPDVRTTVKWLHESLYPRLQEGRRGPPVMRLL